MQIVTRQSNVSVEAFFLPFFKQQKKEKLLVFSFNIHKWRELAICTNLYFVTILESLVYNAWLPAGTIATNINRQLEQVGFKNLGVNERPNLVVLRQSNIPAVLVEVGFINNEKDNELFDREFDAIARAIADGIAGTLWSW